MKEKGFILAGQGLKLAVFVVVFTLGCSALAAAQSVQGQITVITPGTPIFAVSGDYYQVTVRAGNLTVYTVGSSDTEIYIYDSSAQRLAYDDDSGTNYNAKVSITVPAGTFFIRVGYAGDSGPYVLHVEAQR
jgi:hypothetical protein